MAILDNLKSFFSKSEKQPVVNTTLSYEHFDRFMTVNMAQASLPLAIEKKGSKYVWYGDDNMYPHFLRGLADMSPIHSRIISNKAAMMAGKGLLLNGAKTTDENKIQYDSLPQDVKDSYDHFLENPFGNMPLQDLMEACSLDYQELGYFTIEVIWSLNFEKISALRYIDAANVRPTLICDGKVKEYGYSRDWSKERKSGYEPKDYAAFDINDKENVNQILYVKRGNNDYFGKIPYVATLRWINVDAGMAIFFDALIQNGFNPSMHVAFFEKPGSEEEERRIQGKLKRGFTGPERTGKLFTTFADGKELSPEITPIGVTGLDKQFIEVNQRAVQQIMTGHGATNPLLFGISTPGQLGGGDQLEQSYVIFDNSVVQPDRQKLERTINMLLDINKIPVTTTIQKFNPLIPTV